METEFCEQTPVLEIGRPTRMNPNDTYSTLGGRVFQVPSLEVDELGYSVTKFVPLDLGD
jgi:hypothetical protein